MHLLIGLGNPGRKYSKTRHNIGFAILDRLADDFGFEIDKKKFKGSYVSLELFDKKMSCIKPQNYMNLSGEVVVSFLNYYKVNVHDLLVVHDDIDLPIGKLRFSFGSGHAGHNGIRSIIDYLGTKDFYRLRFGIGRPPENFDPADYVLTAFEKEEKVAIESAVDDAVKAIEHFYKDGPKIAMQLFNK